MKIGLIKETKTPVDNRVALTPQQAAWLQDNYGIKVVAQSSKVRVFSDDEYTKHGVSVVDAVNNCDLLLGIKEVKIDELVHGGKYVFFSHIAKEQPYNKNLLRALIQREITLIDYEYIVDCNGRRSVAFGYYAGAVGAYNAIRLYGLKYKKFELAKPYPRWTIDTLRTEVVKKKAILQHDKVGVLITGTGRAAQGAMAVLGQLACKEIVVDMIGSDKMVTSIEGRYNRNEYHLHPSLYRSKFDDYTKNYDILVSCHYWDMDAPVFLTNELMSAKDNRIKVVADVTCDINGSIACTIRPSTHDKPFYDYSPMTYSEVPLFVDGGNISVMAVDTLPNALPASASREFGDMLINNVIIPMMDGDDKAIQRATIVDCGRITKKYQYLKSWLEE